MSQDQWTVDFIEGELPPTVKAELRNEIRRNDKLKTDIEDLQNLKRNIEDNDPGELLLDDAFFDKMHDQIMARVEVAEIAPKKKSRMKIPARFLWSGITAASLCLVVLASVQFQKRMNESQTVQPDLVLGEALERPDRLAELLSHQDENDFYVDVASQNFQNLSAQDVEKILGEL